MRSKLLLLALLTLPAFAQYFPPSTGSGSGVTAVTGSGVIQSSGGPTPNIMCPTCLASGGALGTPSSGELKNTTIDGATPAAIFSCAVLDNAICTSAVDASGNPNFLATAAGLALPINGGSTPLVMFIKGVYQNLNSNITLTVPSTNSVQQWILALQDTTNANMVAADFEAMNTAPFYGYTAPTCPSPSPALSSTNPAFWFDLSTNLSKLCTSNGGSYSPAASMVIGTIYVDATPNVLNALTEPYRLNAYRRFEYFGTGADGILTITSGTTTIDTHKQYQSILITAGTLAHTVDSSNFFTVGVSVQSQNPTMLIGTGSISANALGGAGAAGTTGAGASGIARNGRGGAGGGGGGSGTVSATGGVGAGKVVNLNNVVTGGGTAGAATPTAGGLGSSSAVEAPDIYSLYQCAGGGGGSGGGDGTNAGGAGGIGGGSIFIKTPSILAISTAAITANGSVGSNGVAGNAAGGGGGGGGCVVLNAGFLNVSAGTITASGGGGGAKFGSGTGTAGGSGGAGLVQENKLW